jgi:ABC-type Fe3+-siderophore transport system permease subunit
MAHVLELPGKLRLDRDAYFAVQRIYYPGFTIGGGVGDAGGLIATLILVLLTPAGTPAFWLALAALLGLVAMNAVYWIFTHPLNRYWLTGEALGSLGAGFFSFDVAKRSQPEAARRPNWQEFRDRWEYSHLARAVFAVVSLTALVISLTDAAG